MATPMSAFFSAGASLTPSPVIATEWPVLLQRGDDAELVRRARRGRRPGSPRPRGRAPSSSIASSSAPVTARPSVRMPSSRAIACAVSGWSPVIITGRIPACCARLRRRSRASGRGGSIIPTRPRNVSSRSASSSVASDSPRDGEHAQRLAGQLLRRREQRLAVPRRRAPPRRRRSAAACTPRGSTSGAPFAYATDALVACVQGRHALASPTVNGISSTRGQLAVELGAVAARPSRRRRRARPRSGRRGRATRPSSPRSHERARRRRAPPREASRRQRRRRLDRRAVAREAARPARSRRRRRRTVSPATNDLAHGHLVLRQRAGLVASR